MPAEGTDMAETPALIFIGGDAPHPHIIDVLPRDAFVIAADSGWEHAVNTGFTPHVLIGDMDSISAEHLQQARSMNVNIIEHHADKDFTDAELALALAADHHHHTIHLVSGGGDRFDHLLALVHSLAPHAGDNSLTAHVGSSRLHIIQPGHGLMFGTTPGQTISLIPLGGAAKGVTTTGLKWNLTKDTLRPFASRGVSNVATDSTVTLTVRKGHLAVIIPLALES
jgi:thiamine pyrophosphokinase